MIGVERAAKCEDKEQAWDFPGSSVVKNAHFKAGGMGLIPGQGTKMLQVTCCCCSLVARVLSVICFSDHI